MPYFTVTKAWLREKCSELARVSRNFASSTDLSTYWNRMTANVQTANEQHGSLRDSMDRILAYTSDLEDKLDAKS